MGRWECWGSGLGTASTRVWFLDAGGVTTQQLSAVLKWELLYTCGVGLAELFTRKTRKFAAVIASDLFAASWWGREKVTGVRWP